MTPNTVLPSDYHEVCDEFAMSKFASSTDRNIALLEEVHRLRAALALRPGGEPSDAEIDAVTAHQWGEQLGVMVTAHRTYARAVLALRPVGGADEFLSRCYQDAAGTILVTAVDQPVGLIRAEPNTGEREALAKAHTAVRKVFKHHGLADPHTAIVADLLHALVAQAPSPVAPSEPDNSMVICPNCVHQFRAIPVDVQRLMLDAGFEPPFTERAAIPDAPVAPSEPPFITAMIDARREQYALDQTCTPAFLHWLDTMTPRAGVGANEAWNAGVEWQKSQPEPRQTGRRIIARQLMDARRQLRDAVAGGEGGRG